MVMLALCLPAGWLCTRRACVSDITLHRSNFTFVYPRHPFIAGLYALSCMLLFILWCTMGKLRRYCCRMHHVLASATYGLCSDILSIPCCATDSHLFIHPQATAARRCCQQQLILCRISIWQRLAPLQPPQDTLTVFHLTTFAPTMAHRHNTTTSRQTEWPA